MMSVLIIGGFLQCEVTIRQEGGNMLEVYCLFLVSFDHHTSYYLRCCWHSTKLHLYDQNVTILTISRIYGILIVHLMLFSFQNFVSFCMEAQAKPAKLKIY